MKLKTVLQMKEILREHGGKGSGNFGHAGRPGHVGGSIGKGKKSSWKTNVKGNYTKWDFKWFKDRGAEMIPVDWALKAIEYNRLNRPFTSNISDLAKDIKDNGLQEELILDWSEANNKVFIGEGNHRIQALKILGYSHVPARIVKSRMPNEKGIQVKGIKPDRFGYVPSTPSPKKIGIPGAIPIDEFKNFVT